MSEWKEVELSELINFGNGKKKPESEGDIPIYGGNGILGFSADSNYEDETIIIGRVGAYCGSVYYENKPIWVSDNALAAKAKNGNSTKFLYYFLKNANLNQHAGGSSHPLVTQTLLNSLEYEVCIDETEQNSIASVLSSLDDKIDLLHRQNQTLEQMAETLFRQWFVEEADEDYEEIALGNLITINGGFSYKGKFIGSGESLLLGMGCVSFTDRFLHSGARSYSGEFPDKHLIMPGEIVIATRQQSDNLPILGYPAMVPDEYSGKVVIVGTNLYRVQNDSTLENWVLFQLLRSNNYRVHIKSNAKGSTVRMITKDAVESFTFYLPPKEKLEKYTYLGRPIYEKLNHNQTQIRTLTALRDTLIPKLMSGEVRVSQTSVI